MTLDLKKKKKEQAAYDKKRLAQRNKMRKLYKFEGLPGETFTNFCKRLKKNTNLDQKLLKKAIRETPMLKKYDVFDWAIRMLQHYAKIRYESNAKI